MPTVTTPDPPAPARARRGLLSRALVHLGGLVLGLVVGACLAATVRELALLWVVLFPAVLWGTANRSAVASAARRPFDLTRAPTADLVAMTIGVVLAVPAALTAVDGDAWRAAALVTVVAVLGFTLLGHAATLDPGATDGPGRAGGRVARVLDGALRGLRTTSGLTNLYLAALGTMLAFPQASEWLPVAAVAGTGALHAVLDASRAPR
ncbi:hypothetical protein [Cellulomonas sp.]|uniref:hypothetical protein n=1 Tax=Cellulomonas sp. TaxID=40001 RepID=UPI0028111D2B|nr:hypothetical protein [Cellulomonas sp.]